MFALVRSRFHNGFSSQDNLLIIGVCLHEFPTFRLYASFKVKTDIEVKTLIFRIQSLLFLTFSPLCPH